MNAALDLRNPITPWENEIWTPEPVFKGETVFCVASGPSLTQALADKLKGRRVIVVNSSCMLAPWADVLFFTDSGWYDARKELVENWPGLIVTMSRQAKRELPGKVKRVKSIGDPTFPPRLPGPAKTPGFPPPGSVEIQQGRTSGHTAVSLAIALGAVRVPLVGYDMQVVNGREHFHSEYKGPRDLTLYEKEFKNSFNGWNDAAQNSGVSIINCTPGSAITEFPFADLDEVLTCARS